VSTTKRISVVLPVYNGEKYLGEAIRSVLAQTYSDFQLVVVENGSTDGTKAILAGFADPRMRVIYLPEAGLVGALNAGIQATDSEFIARMDADDVCVLNDSRGRRRFSLHIRRSDSVAHGL